MITLTNEASDSRRLHAEVSNVIPKIADGYTVDSAMLVKNFVTPEVIEQRRYAPPQIVEAVHWVLSESSGSNKY